MSLESTASSDTKLRWEARKLPLEVTLLALAIAYALAFSLGAVLIFFYFFHYDFNPGGISASDTVLMSLASFALLLVASMFLLVGACAVYPVCAFYTYLCERVLAYRVSRVPRLDDGGIDTAKLGKMLPHGVQINWQPRRNRWTLIIGSLFWLAAPVVWYVGPRGPGVLSAAFALLAAGLWPCLWLFGDMRRIYSVLPREAEPAGAFFRLPIWAIQCLLGSAVIVITLLLGFRQLMDISLMTVGFRKQNVDVQLAKADFQRLVDRATRSGVAVNPCETLKEDAFVLNHVDVVWHKLGTKGLLEFPTQDLWAGLGAKRDAFRIEPLNTDINVVESPAAQFACAEFLTDAVFASGSADAIASAGTRMARDIIWLEQPLAGRMVRVTVHGAESDGTLNHQRALAVQDFLVRRYHLKPATITTVDARDSEPKLSCDRQEGTALRLCQRMNRRIEILRYAPGDLISPL